MIDIFLFEIYFISFYIIIVNQITIWDVGQTVKMSACHAVRSGFNSRNARKHANYYLGEYSNSGRTTNGRLTAN